MNNIEHSPYLQVLGGLDLKNHYHLQYKNLFILAFITISKQIDRDDLSNVFYNTATDRRSSLRGCLNKINKQEILQSNTNILSPTPRLQCDLYELTKALDVGDHEIVRQLYRNPGSKLLQNSTLPKKSSMDLESWLEEINQALLERVYYSRITLLSEQSNQQSHYEHSHYELCLIAKECLALFPYEIDLFDSSQETYLKAATRLYHLLVPLDDELAAKLADKVWEEAELKLKVPNKEQPNLQVIGAIEESKIAHFKGRQQENTRLKSFLQSEVKLIQILGRAGIGKTSFVTKFIRDLKEEADKKTSKETEINYHAILFTNLDANTPSLLPELLFRILEEEQLKSVQSFLDNDTLPLDYKWERIFSETLKDLRIVFVIDNFESCLLDNHITHTELAIFIKTFLNCKHQSKLIITSRYEAITDELVRQPEQTTMLRLPELSIYDSIELLKDRDDVQGRFTQASQTQFLEIVKRCHGIPRIYDVLLLKLRKEPLTTIDMLLNSTSIEDVLAAPAKVMLDQLCTSDLRLLEILAAFTEPVPLKVILFMANDTTDRNPDTETDISADIKNQSLLAQLNGLVNSAALIMDEQRNLSLHPLDRNYLLNHVLPQSSTKLETLHLQAAKYYQSQRKEKASWLEPSDLLPQLKEFEHLYEAGHLNPTHYNEAAHTLSDIEFSYLLSWGKSQDILERRQSLIGKLSEPMLIGQNYNSLGVACINLRHFELSIKYLGLSIYHYLKIKQPLATRMSYHSIGNLATTYTKLGKLDKAIKLYKYNIKVTKKLKNSQNVFEKEIYESLAVDYTLIGDTYVEARAPKNALGFYKKAQNFFTETARIKYPHFYAACYLGIARAHLQNQELAKAKEFAIIANRLARKNQEHQLTIESLCLKATLECMSGEFQLALDLFNTALTLSSKISELNLEIDTYAAMYKAFKNQENYLDIAQNSRERGVLLAEQINNDRHLALFLKSE